MRIAPHLGGVSYVSELMHLGLLGILLIVLGSYFLNIQERHKGYILPFKALIRERGPRLMLLVALIWSITSNFDKIGIGHSSPIFWAVTVNVFIALVLLSIMLYRSGNNMRYIRTNFVALLPIGVCAAATSIFQMVAISLTLVVYVIAIKRTSAIMSVLFGHFVFKEKGVRERLTGAVTMLAGVLCIAFS
jgi:uncharacterized membrane protein